MTTLRERVEAALKQAMLAKDEVARDALRLTKSELLNREVELGHPLSDEEAAAVMKRIVKQRRDSIDEYRAAGRADLLEKEEKELVVLAPFLPKTMDEAATRAAIAAIASELGLATKKDMGRLMKELKARHEGVDGKLASTLAGEILK